MSPPLGFAVARQHGGIPLQPTPPPLASAFLLPSPSRPHCPCVTRRKLRLFAKEDDEEMFLQRELARIEAMENIQDDIEDDDNDVWLDDDDLDPDAQDLEEMERTFFGMQLTPKSAASLEEALLQGVVPADAGVGSGSLAGDFGFDPMNMSDKDYIGRMQRYISNLIPSGYDEEESVDESRPSALILRDYREAEIRHGRLAMLAAFLWPLQEMLDQLLLDEDQFGSLLYGGITLPYIPLFMTAIMLLLGYLDVYSRAIKDMEDLGEAFLPGDCFWDPLSILAGAPDSMKRNMQERELFNGRMAMLAFALYIWEEAITGKPLISIPGNELLFEPAYQIPFIQQWLDSQFGSATPPLPFPEAADLVETVEEAME